MKGRRTADELVNDVFFGQQRDRAELERDIHELNTLEQANYLRRLYRATGNTLIVWQVYALYRRAALPIPEDVLRMLDRFAEALQSASGAKETAQALGLTGEKGGAQGAAALAKASRHLHLVTDVYIRMEHDKVMPAAGRWGSTRIYAAVAKDHRTTAGAVKRAWLRHLEKAGARVKDRKPAGDTFDALNAALRPRKVRPLAR